MAAFRDLKWTGDTIQRSAYLVDRRTGALRDLEGYTATYSARPRGDPGPPTILASEVGSAGDTEISPLVDGGQTGTAGSYDAWVHVHSPDGSLELSLQGALEIRERPE